MSIVPNDGQSRSYEISSPLVWSIPLKAFCPDAFLESVLIALNLFDVVEVTLLPQVRSELALFKEVVRACQTSKHVMATQQTLHFRLGRSWVQAKLFQLIAYLVDVGLHCSLLVIKLQQLVSSYRCNSKGLLSVLWNRKLKRKDVGLWGLHKDSPT